MSGSNTTTRTQNSPPLVYVVDDNVALTKMAEMILTAEGFQCHAFCDPKQVVAAVKRGAPFPDLLLTDYEMGSMTGLELIAHCRGAIPALKTVLVSGTVKAESLLSQSVQVDQFLSKPYKPDELAKAIKTLLKR